MGTSRSVLRHIRMFRLLVVAALLAAAVLQLSTALAGTTIAVNTTADTLNTDGSCSLREAIRAANLNTAVGGCPAGSAASPDTITIPPGTYTVSRIGANEDSNATGDFDIAGNVAIDGAGQTILNGGGLDRVLHVLAGVTASITDLTITNGLTPRVGQDGDHGGGIYNQGILTLSYSTVTNNSTPDGAEGTFDEDDEGMGEGLSGGNGGNGGGIYTVGTLTLTASTVSNNSTGDGGVNEGHDLTDYGGDGGSGGGIFNQGTMTIRNSAIIENTTGASGDGGYKAQGSGLTGAGGGISNEGTLSVTNSTISGNAIADDYHGYLFPAGGDGGGINNRGDLVLNAVTISGNSAGDRGGGIADAESATTSFQNTILAGNTVTSALPEYEQPTRPSDCTGTLTSAGNNLVQTVEDCTIVGDTTGNLIGVDPKLDPLQDNDGPTFTHALLAGSPAIDAGSTAGCPATDQRGITRPQDGNGDGSAVCDIGAFERRPAQAPTATATHTRTATPTRTRTPTGTHAATSLPIATGTRTSLPIATGTATSLPDATATRTATSLPGATPTRTPEGQVTTVPTAHRSYLPFVVNTRRAGP